MKRTRNAEDIALRRKEIVDACERLYQEKDYHDINLKSIASKTVLSRPSLYNYFSSKEEIFLALLGRYFLHFGSEMEEDFSDPKATFDELADKLTETYFHHLRLMELISVHLTDIETHCSMEELTAFKKIWSVFVQNTKKALLVYRPSLKPDQIDFFQKSLTSLFFGVYPIIHPLPIQVEAMKKAGIEETVQPKDFVRRSMLLLLTILEEK